MNTYIVHLIIRNNAQLNNNGARPIHEVYMEMPAPFALKAEADVVNWHVNTFGPMDIEVATPTRRGTLAR